MKSQNEIVEQVKALAADLETGPGRKTFEKRSGVTEAEWRRHWPRWGDVLVAAGLNRNEPPQKLNESELLHALATLVRAHGRMPTQPEMRIYNRAHPGTISESTYAKYFPTKADRVKALRSFCETDPDYQDLLSLLPADREAPEALAGIEDDEQPVAGYVYLQLLKTRRDKIYTIGRSNDIERRAREISKSLPHTTEDIHRISTDDVVGIERYWHHRFRKKQSQEKREWFYLSPSDVKAFKKRKFQ